MEDFDFDAVDILAVILAILFPPLAVILETGCSVDLLINILLTILAWFPGMSFQ